MVRRALACTPYHLPYRLRLNCPLRVEVSDVSRHCVLPYPSPRLATRCLEGRVAVIRVAIAMYRRGCRAVSSRVSRWPGQESSQSDPIDHIPVRLCLAAAWQRPPLSSEWPARPIARPGSYGQTVERGSLAAAFAAGRCVHRPVTNRVLGCSRAPIQ